MGWLAPESSDTCRGNRKSGKGLSLTVSRQPPQAVVTICALGGLHSDRLVQEDIA